MELHIIDAEENQALSEDEVEIYQKK